MQGVQPQSSSAGDVKRLQQHSADSLHATQTQTAGRRSTQHHIPFIEMDVQERYGQRGLTESWTVPAPGVPLALNTVPFTASVAPGPAGLGVTVSVMVARAGATVIVVGADVYVPGVPGAGNMSVKVEPLTGNVYCAGDPVVPVT